MKIIKDIAVIEGDTHISKWVEETGKLDHDESALKQILPYIKEGDVVIDCGAFIGDHTIAYARVVGSSGTVIAIEPNCKAYECLEHNMRKVDCKKILLNIAVTELMDSEAGFKINTDSNAGASHIEQVEGGGDIGAITIDGLSLERCDFIKMDIEGFEVKALRGAMETIKKFRPVMVIEVNEGALRRCGNTPKDIFDMLSEYYTISNIYSEIKMEGEQYDILCIKK